MVYNTGAREHEQTPSNRLIKLASHNSDASSVKTDMDRFLSITYSDKA